MTPVMESPTSGIASVQSEGKIKVMVNVKGKWRSLYTTTIKEFLEGGDHIVQFSSERYEEAAEDPKFNATTGV